MRFSVTPLTGFLISIFICLLAVSSAQAITIDEFDGDALVVNDGTPDSSASFGQINIPADGTGRSSVIGSNREFNVFAFAGTVNRPNRMVSEIGYLTFSQDQGASGVATVTWDGDQTGGSIVNYQGLGGVDFTQDGSTSIDLDIISFDYANQQPTEIEIIMYSDEGHASSASIILNVAIPSATKKSIPYSSFVKAAGKAFPVDFKSIGAIQMKIWGLNRDVDLAIEKIGTDSCPYVPNANNKVVDECGVCNGDNSACADCLGVPNGTSLPGTLCDNGEQGVCNGGTFTNSCSCERNEEPTTELCDGLDNNCDGDIDESFPSLDTTCGIGEGLCEFHGTIICSEDHLGVKCDDADALKDLSDQCEEDKGCDGIPNSGLEFDNCGVCGGDNSSCTDCKGILNGTAKKDRCGICNGDGQSCLNCDTFDQSALLNSIDGGSLAQERLINKFNRNLKKLDSSPRALRFIKRTNALASELQAANWGITWSLPVNVTTCGNTKFCIATSNQDRIGIYQAGSEELRKLGQKVIRKVKKAGASANLLGRMERANNAQHALNVEFTNQVPVVQSVCSK